MPPTTLTKEQSELILGASPENWDSIKSSLPDNYQKSNASMMRRRKGLPPFSAISYSYKENFFYDGGLRACYWAGFIAADGYISKNAGLYDVLGIALKSSDDIHLEAFVRDLGDGKIYHCKNKLEGVDFEYARVNVCNSKICQSLTNRFNITERKSLSLKPPVALTKDEALAFIAGYIDGDGSYTYSKQNGVAHPVISVLGTEEVLIWIKNSLGYPNKRVYSQGNIKELKFFGKDALTVRKKLYTLDGEIPFLERKYKRWERELQIDVDAW